MNGASERNHQSFQRGKEVTASNHIVAGFEQKGAQRQVFFKSEIMLVSSNQVRAVVDGANKSDWASRAGLHVSFSGDNSEQTRQ